MAKRIAIAPDSAMATYTGNTYGGVYTVFQGGHCLGGHHLKGLAFWLLRKVLTYREAMPLWEAFASHLWARLNGDWAITTDQIKEWVKYQTRNAKEVAK